MLLCRVTLYSNNFIFVLQNSNYPYNNDHHHCNYYQIHHPINYPTSYHHQNSMQYFSSMWVLRRISVGEVTQGWLGGNRMVEPFEEFALPFGGATRLLPRDGVMIGRDRMVGFSGKLPRHFGPPLGIEKRGLHYDDETARRWCSSLPRLHPSEGICQDHHHAT